MKELQKSGYDLKKLLMHWLSLLIAVFLTLMLKDIGNVDNQATGLILLLLFALATFQTGITMGWLFRSLGILLVVSLAFVAYAEHYIRLILTVSVAVVFTYGYFE